MAKIYLRGSDPVTIPDDPRGKQLKAQWLAGELKGIKIDLGFTAFPGIDVKRVDLDSEVKNKYYENDRVYDLRIPTNRDKVEQFGKIRDKFYRENPGKGWWEFLASQGVYRIDDPKAPWNGTVLQALGYNDCGKLNSTLSSLRLMQENERRRLESLDKTNG